MNNAINQPKLKFIDHQTIKLKNYAFFPNVHETLIKKDHILSRKNKKSKKNVKIEIVKSVLLTIKLN